jgi:hypothetical protein
MNAAAAGASKPAPTAEAALPRLRALLLGIWAAAIRPSQTSIERTPI